MTDAMIEDARTLTRGWGWYLATGIAWLVFAFFVLSFNYRTVWAVALFFGIGFIIGGIMELGIAMVAPGWRWLHILFGVVAIIAGFMALIWPGQTLLVLGAIVGWLLLAYGIIDIVFAFMSRGIDDMWWLTLITGILAIIIGFWAISPDSATVANYRGVVLVVVWVGAAAILRGISDIIVGFRLHSARKDLSSR
jgi:uncharacterized membrane protein HdeD (DUF308 family)